MFTNFPLWINAALFAGSAILVWMAGTRLAGNADDIAIRTGLRRDFLGILLLGGVTSLPELAVAVTATLAKTPALTVNDLLGSAAMNIVILAVADAVVGRGALTSKLASSGVLLQGVLGIILLALIVAAVTAGDVLLLGVGAWSWLMLVVFAGAIWALARPGADGGWVPVAAAARRPTGTDPQAPEQPRSLQRLVIGTMAIAAVILVAGFVLARTADALAHQTGLGENFVGVAFLAVATSLPEVSTVLAAVRLRRYEMAMSDVLGTNLFNVIIVVLVDALHFGGPVLVEVGRFAAFSALLAIVLTALFLVGMIRRRDRTLLGLGIDSIAVLASYAGGMMVLYQLR